MKPTQIAVASLLVAAMIPAIPTVSAVDSCDDSAWGTGWEYTGCSFDCLAGEYIYVISSQQHSGYVSGDAECADQVAHCNSDLGSCSDTSSGNTDDAASGSCEGSAEKYWATTDAHLTCGANGQGADSKLVMAIIAALESGAQGSACAGGPSGPITAVTLLFGYESKILWGQNGGCAIVGASCSDKLVDNVALRTCVG